MSAQAVVGAPAEAGAPSLVKGHQALGKNNSPRGFRPCPRLPADRIRLQSLEGDHKCAMRCKSWGCELSCGPWLKARFVKVARQQAQALGLRRFLTLTLGPEARDLPVPERFRLMSKVWAKWQKRVVRHPTHHDKNGRPRYKATFTAIWVREVHKDGTPHMHVLIDRYLDQKWASKSWHECGGGKILDIKAVDQQRVVAYVTKYLAKSLGVQVKDLKDPLKGIRRYGALGEASVRGVYPVKKGTDAWGVFWRPDVRAWWDAGLEWVMADRYQVGEIMWHVMRTWGQDVIRIREDPEAMARLRLRAEQYQPGRWVEIPADGAFASVRMGRVEGF